MLCAPARARREALTATLRMSCIWEGVAPLQDIAPYRRRRHDTLSSSIDTHLQPAGLSWQSRGQASSRVPAGPPGKHSAPCMPASMLPSPSCALPEGRVEVGGHKRIQHGVAQELEALHGGDGGCHPPNWVGRRPGTRSGTYTRRQRLEARDKRHWRGMHPVSNLRCALHAGQGT